MLIVWIYSGLLRNIAGEWREYQEGNGIQWALFLFDGLWQWKWNLNGKWNWERRYHISKDGSNRGGGILGRSIDLVISLSERKIASKFKLVVGYNRMDGWFWGDFIIAQQRGDYITGGRWWRTEMSWILDGCRSIIVVVIVIVVMDGIIIGGTDILSGVVVIILVEKVFGVFIFTMDFESSFRSISLWTFHHSTQEGSIHLGTSSSLLLWLEWGIDAFFITLASSNAAGVFSSSFAERRKVGRSPHSHIFDLFFVDKNWRRNNLLRKKTIRKSLFYRMD